MCCPVTSRTGLSGRRLATDPVPQISALQGTGSAHIASRSVLEAREVFEEFNSFFGVFRSGEIPG